MSTATVTLVEGVLALLKAAGLTAYIIDGTKTGSCCVVVPYNSEHEKTAPIGTQYMQIRVASDSYKKAEANAWTAYNALADKKPTGTDRETVGLIRALQEPFYWGKSEDGTRYIMIFNIALSAIDK